MAREILKKFLGCLELAAYLVVIISVFQPYVSVDLGESKIFSYYTQSANYIGTFGTNGVIVLIFSIISALFVAINTFARNVVENLKNDNKNSAKTIDVLAELIPFIFTFVSFILIIINAKDTAAEVKEVNYFFNIAGLGIGYYLLLVGIIIAFVVRILYIIFGKNYLRFSNKPVAEPVAEQTADVNVQVIKY